MGFTEVTFLFIFLPAAIVFYLSVEKIFHNDIIEVKVYLQKGMLYKYVFEIERLTPTEVVIKGPSFVQLV